MKTFSRGWMERLYEGFDHLNPLLGAITNFKSMLNFTNKEFDELVDKLSVVKVNIARSNNSGKYDLVNVPYWRLRDIYEYGHSLVIQGNNSLDDYELNKTVWKDLIDSNESVCVTCNDCFVFLIAGDCNVKYNKKYYNCRRLAYVTGNMFYECYFVDTQTYEVILTTSYSYLCSLCWQEYKCTHRGNRGSVEVHNDDSYSYKPDYFPIDIKYCRRHKDNIAEAINVLTKNYEEYINLLKKYAEERNAAKKKIGNEEKHKKSETVKDRKVDILGNDNNGEEVIIPISKHARAISRIHKGGHHASPKCHNVPGYWRRRSKKDSTLIFVKSFVRGGSDEDKEKLKVSGSKKQKVYDLNN